MNAFHIVYQIGYETARRETTAGGKSERCFVFKEFDEESFARRTMAPTKVCAIPRDIRDDKVVSLGGAPPLDPAILLEKAVGAIAATDTITIFDNKGQLPPHLSQFILRAKMKRPEMKYALQALYRAVGTGIDPPVGQRSSVQFFDSKLKSAITTTSSADIPANDLPDGIRYASIQVANGGPRQFGVGLAPFAERQIVVSSPGANVAGETMTVGRAVSMLAAIPRKEVFVHLAVGYSTYAAHTVFRLELVYSSAMGHLPPSPAYEDSFILYCPFLVPGVVDVGAERKACKFTPFLVALPQLMEDEPPPPFM